jgi:hypothetical protein
VKTDRCDAIKLARSLRAGYLSAVYVPCIEDEAVAGNGTTGSEGLLFMLVAADAVGFISGRETPVRMRQEFTRAFRVLVNFAGPTR